MLGQLFKGLFLFCNRDFSTWYIVQVVFQLSTLPTPPQECQDFKERHNGTEQNVQNWPGNMRNQGFQENCKTTQFSFSFFHLFFSHTICMHCILPSLHSSQVPTKTSLLHQIYCSSPSLQERAGFPEVSAEHCRIKTIHKSSKLRQDVATQQEEKSPKSW